MNVTTIRAPRRQFNWKGTATAFGVVAYLSLGAYATAVGGIAGFMLLNKQRPQWHSPQTVVPLWTSTEGDPRQRKLLKAALIGTGMCVFVFLPLGVLSSTGKKRELHGYTGIDAPYEPPVSPDLRVETENISNEENALRILEFILRATP